MKHLDMIREFQTIEGMTIMDGTDKFETHSYSFAGIADVLLRFAEQVSGATGIPSSVCSGSPLQVSTPATAIWKTTTAALTRCRSDATPTYPLAARYLLAFSVRSNCLTISPLSLTSSGRCPTWTAQRWRTTWLLHSLRW
jgi:hypothetical protein